MIGGDTLVFSSGARVGALPLRHVHETMRPLPVDPIAGSLPFVDGMAVVRGAAIPVVNLAKLLGDGRGGAVNRFVTVRVGDRTIALAVSEVLGVWPAATLNVGTLPPLLDGAIADAVAAIGHLDGRLLIVLRAASLIPPEKWSELSSGDGGR
jgi:purine-binding chemotaxis protein CheW